MLHLEDSPTDVELIGYELRKCDFEFERLVVSDKEGYVKALESFCPDIVLSDHSLPSFNSLKAFAILQEINANIPFILITSRMSEEYAVEMMKEGFDDYIFKDRLQRLPIAVKKAINKKNEEKLKQLLAREREISEMRLKFVSLASHEFRTPLGTILSSSFLLSKYVNTEDQGKRRVHIDRIIASVNLLTETLNDYLSISKIDNQKLRVYYSSFSITDITSAIVDTMRLSSKEGQTLIYDHEGLDLVDLDSTLYNAILTNLISNSIKYANEDGLINVRTIVTNSTYILSVKDNGIGIPKEEIPLLFEYFFRASNAANIKGTGLGLYIVRRYIELMNGVIECKSELGTGTEFIVQFKLNN